MTNDGPAELLDLYERAVVCQTFPAYRLDDDIPVEAIWAVQLLDTVQKVRNG